MSLTDYITRYRATINAWAFRVVVGMGMLVYLAGTLVVFSQQWVVGVVLAIAGIAGAIMVATDEH